MTPSERNQRVELLERCMLDQVERKFLMDMDLESDKPLGLWDAAWLDSLHFHYAQKAERLKPKAFRKARAVSLGGDRRHAAQPL